MGLSRMLMRLVSFISRPSICIACLLLAPAITLPATAPAVDVNEIVNRSVQNNDANWKAAPQYAFKERDIITKSGRRTTHTYEVIMIEGSPYQKTIAINGKPLTPAQVAREDRKMQRAIQRRRSESPAARQKRIAEYLRERHQDHALMHEMIKAFSFRLVGEETIDGRRCYRVDATPKPGYAPPSRDTKVLTGMRGTLWIDTTQLQWVRVTAAVFRPVAFGLFIARVQPGTEFTLDEAPVAGNIWQPSHFVTKVNATILFWWSRNSVEDDTYWDYHRIDQSRLATK
jgi:hypothetical protein